MAKLLGINYELPQVGSYQIVEERMASAHTPKTTVSRHFRIRWIGCDTGLNSPELGDAKVLLAQRIESDLRSKHSDLLHKVKQLEAVLAKIDPHGDWIEDFRVKQERNEE